MTTQNIQLGTVSHGTMREEDLIPAFESAVMAYSEELFAQYTRDSQSCSNEDKVELLFDILGEMAPEGCYFGAHLGDGSDYGFWEIEED